MTSQNITPKRQSADTEQQKIQELEARINRLEREKATLKSYRSFDVGRTRSHTLIDQFSEQELIDVLFSVRCSSLVLYAHRLRRRRVDAHREVITYMKPASHVSEL